MRTKEIVRALNEHLQPEKFKDYAPNGLQIEGNPETTKVLCGVSASEELIDMAIEQGAQTLIVHHGYFWKNESLRITGIKRNRIKKILENDINLIAYHLPLDAHEEIGNNIELAKLLKLQNVRPIPSAELGLLGNFLHPVSIDELSNKIVSILGRKPFVVSVDSAPLIDTVAFCTGAAQDLLEIAADNGAQAYLSGEISERTVLESRELKVPYFSIGHHASETLGIRALSHWLQSRFANLEVSFADIDNPV